MTAAKKQLVDLKLLKTLVPLSELDDQRLMRLQEHVVIESIEPGTQLFAKGERDGLTYFLLSGQVQLTFVSGLEKLVNADSGAACRALAPEQPRTATAIATTPLTLLSIETSLLHELQDWGHQGYQVSDIDGEDNSDWMTLFLQSKVFLKLPAQNIQALMMRMEEMTMRRGKVIIRQGDDDGYYYIIKRGHARVTRRFSPEDEEVELAVLGPGAGFGEEAIITHNRRGATVTMIDNGSLMRLSRNEFNDLLVQPLINELDYQQVKQNKDHVFLDVRSYDDYIEDGIAGSLNISIAELRPKIAMLESGKQYVVCSNTSSRAAAAAFLLCQQGIDAVVLKNGLQGLPDEVKRGNQSAPRGDEIPLVDNVVSFKKSTGVEPATTGPVDAEQAMKDPRVQSLFSRAKRRVQHESQRARQAEDARLKAESEVQRLKAEAEQARLEAEEAQRQVEQAAQSAQAARLQVKREAAHLREIELGAKQAEMEEAVRQAEQEAQRAHDAEAARQQAEQEIERLKFEMQQALLQAQEEAKKSAETMRQFVEEQARKEKEAAERRAAEEQQEKEMALLRAEENERRAAAAEQARLQAEAEIERLHKEAEQARFEADKQAREMVEAARTQAEQEIARARADQMSRTQREAEQVLRRAEEEAARAQAAEKARLDAEAEIERLRHEAETARLTADAVRIAAEQETARVRAEAIAKKQYELEQAAQKAAEEARRQAEQEIALVKLQAAQERQHLEEQASRAAESARIESEQKAQQKAIAEAQRAMQAEQARLQAEEEIARLKAEAELARKQIQEQLSDEVARSEIEHEVARVRAEELANKQWEIEEMARKAEEESTRARAAEEARLQAEVEIQRLKAEAEVTRNQIHHAQGDNSVSDVLLTQTLTQKQNEIDAVARHAREEADRAHAAEEARRQAQDEIDRLREEVAIATLQAQAQLERDAERAAVEEETVRLRAAELSQKEAQIQTAIEKAELEAKRAREAEQARVEAEAEIRRLRATEVAHQEAQQEIERLRAGMAYYQAQEQAKANIAEAEKRAKKEVLMAARKAAVEKRRAETAEQARLQAEQEIARLKQEAEAQRRKSEQTIQSSIKQAKRKLDEKTVRMRAAQKARRLAEKNRDNDDYSKKYEDTQRVRPVVRSAPVKPRNTVDHEPLVDIMPNVLPEEPVIDLDADVSAGDTAAWVSDKVMWEATIGVREDKVAEKMVTPSPAPEFVQPAPVVPAVAFTPAPAPAQAAIPAQFTVRDVNPYVNTQQVKAVFRRSSHGRIRKILMAVIGCVVLGGAGYYMTLDQVDKTRLHRGLNDMVNKDGTIKKLTSSVKAEINHLSQKAKASISNTNTENAKRAQLGQSSLAQPSAGAASQVAKHAKPVVKREESKEPLSIEERVRLKVEKKLKQQKAQMERLKRQHERALEKEPLSSLESSDATSADANSTGKANITVLSVPAQMHVAQKQSIKPVLLVDPSEVPGSSVE